MSAKLAIDTNILAYSEGIDDAERQAKANELISRLSADSTYIALQTLGELFNVRIRKGRRTPQAAATVVRELHSTFPAIETSDAVLIAAIDLAVDHGLQIWDAIILAAAADAGCSLLLSEDMQDGFVWRGVTVANPFKAPQHPLLVSVLEGR